jgi:hypothetical protein
MVSPFSEKAGHSSEECGLWDTRWSTWSIREDPSSPRQSGSYLASVPKKKKKLPIPIANRSTPSLQMSYRRIWWTLGGLVIASNFLGNNRPSYLIFLFNLQIGIETKVLGPLQGEKSSFWSLIACDEPLGIFSCRTTIWFPKRLVSTDLIRTN